MSFAGTPQASQLAAALEAAGGSAQPGGDKAGESGITRDAVAEMLHEQMAALKENLSKEITGATTRIVADKLGGALKGEEFSKAMQAQITAAFQAVEAEKNKKPPSDIQALQTQVQTLSGQLQTEAQKRAEAESKSRDQQLRAGIQTVLNGLDGKDGRPALRADARQAVFELVRTGFQMPGVPSLDEAGNVVVAHPDGAAKPLSDILGNGFFKNAEWATERKAAAGGGMRGSASPNQQSGGGFDPWKNYGSRQSDEALAKQYDNDPQGLLAALQKRAAGG